MTMTTRRTVLAGRRAAAAALPFGARAQGANDLKGTTVVFASWGGAYQEAEKVAYCEPFEKATGAKVVQDGPMNVAKFRAMAASGTPDWDVVDVTGGFLEVAAKDGLLEKIDPKLVHLEPHRSALRARVRRRLHRLVVQSRLQHDGLPQRRAEDLGRPVRPQEVPRQAHRCSTSRWPRSRSRCWPTAWRPTSSIRSTSTAPSRSST